MKKWIYIGVLVVAAVTLAVGGWIVQGSRAMLGSSRRPVLKAA